MDFRSALSSIRNSRARRTSTLAPAIVLAAMASAPAAQFINGDFETGDFTGWTVEYGNFPYVNGVCPGTTGWTPTLPGGHPGEAIHTASSPNQPGQTLSVLPFGGANMARLNNIAGGYHATRISQEVVLTAAEIAAGYVQVDWGAMLVNPSNHGGGCQPAFSIDVLLNSVSIDSFSADGNDAAAVGSGWVDAGYSGGTLWHTTGQFCTDITQSHPGDVIEVLMAVNDCGFGGHGGFAYLDNVGFGPCLGEECMDITAGDVECDPTTGEVLYTFTLTNNSGVDASWLLIPNPAGVTLSQNVFPLSPPVSGAGGTKTITVSISGATPGPLCFDMVLQDAQFSDCCSTNILNCIDIPDCSPCATDLTINVHCTGVGGNFEFTFSFVNNSDFDMHSLFLIPPPSSGITVFPQFFDLVALTGSEVEPGESATVTTTVMGATPGSTICFTVTVHDANLSDCCSFEVCTFVPFCTLIAVSANPVGIAGPGDSDIFVTGDPQTAAGGIKVNLVEGPANAGVLMAFGLLNFQLPLLGGVLGPADLLVVMPGSTDEAGQSALDLNISQLPTGLRFYAQAIVLDSVQTFGYGFSNTLEVSIF